MKEVKSAEDAVAGLRRNRGHLPTEASEKAAKEMKEKKEKSKKEHIKQGYEPLGKI